ncbi:MAG TPA: hypothetical protein VFZ98_08680, partial [Vicinamibacterales bacterium]
MMTTSPFRVARVAGAIALSGLFTARMPAAPGTLRAGAASVSITPAPDAALPLSGYANRTDPFKGVHDDLHVRAIVVDDGTAQAALIGCEVIGIAASFVDRITERIARETRI